MDKQILECCTAFILAIKSVDMSRKHRVWRFLQVLITSQTQSMQPGISCVETGRKKWAGHGVRNGQGKWWYNLVTSGGKQCLVVFEELEFLDINAVRNRTGVKGNSPVS